MGPTTWNAREWIRTADHTDLIEKIYIYETGEAGERELIRLELDNKSLEEAEPPAKLNRLLKRLSDDSKNLPTALHAWMLSDPRTQLPTGWQSVKEPNSHTDSMTGWQFGQEIPALVVEDI